MFEALAICLSPCTSNLLWQHANPWNASLRNPLQWLIYITNSFYKTNTYMIIHDTTSKIFSLFSLPAADRNSVVLHRFVESIEGRSCWASIGSHVSKIKPLPNFNLIQTEDENWNFFSGLMTHIWHMKKGGKCKLIPLTHYFKLLNKVSKLV